MRRVLALSILLASCNGNGDGDLGDGGPPLGIADFAEPQITVKAGEQSPIELSLTRAASKTTTVDIGNPKPTVVEVRAEDQAVESVVFEKGEQKKSLVVAGLITGTPVALSFTIRDSFPTKRKSLTVQVVP
jgi:hypothetical protein